MENLLNFREQMLNSFNIEKYELWDFDTYLHHIYRNSNMSDRNKLSALIRYEQLNKELNDLELLFK